MTLQEKMQSVESAIFALKVALSQMTDINFGRKDNYEYQAVNRTLESAKLSIEGAVL